jgi:O-methyltransferase
MWPLLLRPGTQALVSIGTVKVRNTVKTEPAGAPPNLDSPELLYLDLLTRCLTRSIFPEAYRPLRPPVGWRQSVLRAVQKALATRGMEVVRHGTFDPAVRATGHDWPADAETMIGLQRLKNVQDCVTDVLRRGVPGDLIETGVWRGGASIFMRGILSAYGDDQRVVWLADSFQGLPKPDAERYPADKGDVFWAYANSLAVSLEQVQANFVRYGLLDEQVRFLVGWLRDTLPIAPIERLAILRIDGDMHGATMDALRPLYPKLSVGGYVIVDDYALAPCKAAIDDFRTEHGISDPITKVDWTGIYWQRSQ